MLPQYKHNDIKITYQFFLIYFSNILFLYIDIFQCPTCPVFINTALSKLVFFTFSDIQLFLVLIFKVLACSEGGKNLSNWLMYIWLSKIALQLFFALLSYLASSIFYIFESIVLHIVYCTEQIDSKQIYSKHFWSSTAL